ncbi:MAG: hypothetical protein C0424_04785 [Sphingobacteriaceae bacterium]|nr:hypothetical protein [Sphingobacteriaceae bacterium]
MNSISQIWIARASLSLARAFVPEGILASEKAVDNYQRVWARDGIMAGVCGLMAGDEALVEQLRLTLLILARNQAPNGQIPSSVGLGNTPVVSYGTLAGRVDASLWWLIGAALLVKHRNDKDLATQFAPTVNKLRTLFCAWEFNHADLLYTPLGGNWADEYVTHGHTLYDNSLRLWAEQLAASIWPSENAQTKVNAIASKTKATFNTLPNNLRYHPEAYQRLKNAVPTYCFAACGPSGYDTRWDAMGNAFALLTGINQQPSGVAQQLASFLKQRPIQLVPAFWPVIQPGDTDWPLLAGQFTHRFKNHPHHFHNGGSWPIATGWLALALAAHGYRELAIQLFNQYVQLLQRTQANGVFPEYYATDSGKPGGVAPLTYSATALLLMQLAIESNPETIQTYFQ